MFIPAGVTRTTLPVRSSRSWKRVTSNDHFTKRIRGALAYDDVRVLDHLIVGEGTGVYSFAEAERL